MLIVTLVASLILTRGLIAFLGGWWFSYRDYSLCYWMDHPSVPFCKWHFGEEMTYPNDIFAMATLMLGMIFPMWSCYSDLFDFWPLPSEK